ncbi:UDP-N-acetylglucosamine 2-epimerase [Labilibacter marinus]|uniref:UDP-N-acetylglucosamine 2-epimerase n=1 Tax=Labilibacter marinus TaxID=1477105 RepID=UPI00094FFE20|nr:UDP-N-acetylglucosamine 2-epimerase [Labilibacter marinus]
MKRICVVTGTRAEYGLLSHLMKLIQASSDLELQIIACNMHLSPEYGSTYLEIEKDGFTINSKVEMMLSSGSANGTVKSIGIGTIGFAEALEQLKPNLLLALGDRYELLSAVNAALIYKIPVAHIHGGEITEGAYDDAIRHAITKMSHLHFTSTEAYRKRVIQLGENPNKVINVGALGVENTKNYELLKFNDFETAIDFEVTTQFFLVTFHPETLSDSSAEDQMKNLLSALDEHKDYKVLFTMPNSDTGSYAITQMIHEYVNLNKKRCTAYKSLGLMRYLSALSHCSAVIGNSSSGIIEAPSFGKPTLNIGDRQKGRIYASSVFNCKASYESISAGLNHILSDNFKQTALTTKNPYEKEGTAENILTVIKKTTFSALIPKRFYDL